MLDHTSGMPDVPDYEWDRPQYDAGGAERYVRSMASEKLRWAPGDGWQYSNMAFDALGDLIAKVSGTSFEDYLRVNILEPLGMNGSSFIHPDIDEALRTTGHVGDSPEQSDVYPGSTSYSMPVFPPRHRSPLARGGRRVEIEQRDRPSEPRDAPSGVTETAVIFAASRATSQCPSDRTRTIETFRAVKS